MRGLSGHKPKNCWWGQVAGLRGAEHVRRAWIGMVREGIVAHQRRGNSDAVAHCLYQLLALDTTAPEWEQALAGPQVAS